MSPHAHTLRNLYLFNTLHYCNKCLRGCLAAPYIHGRHNLSLWRDGESMQKQERRSYFFVVQVTHIQHILIVTYNIGHWYPMHHWLWDRLSSSHGTDVVICLEQDSSTNKQMFQRTEPSTSCTGATLGWRNGGADGLCWHRNRLTSGPSGLATSSHQRKAQGTALNLWQHKAALMLHPH